VSVFVRADDPYSYLLLQVMPELEQRYEVEFSYHVVSNLPDLMYPEPELWHEHALRDSRHIAELYKLDFPSVRALPNGEASSAASEQLIEIEKVDQFAERAIAILKPFWQGEHIEAAEDSRLVAKLAANDSMLESLGHYLSASLHYGGEWYWGIDRLNHLENRLNDLQLSRSTNQVKYQERSLHYCKRLAPLESFPKRPDTPLTIYFSARSPYSYLGLERGVAMAKHYEVSVIVKPVLPMMMRGMNVPPRKKWYIFSDTKREALNLGIDYGFVADPLGVGVERCYSLFEYANEQGKGLEFLLSFARAVNSRGVYSDTDKGMQVIVEDACLDWSKAKIILEHQFDSEGWRPWAEKNYDEMHALGLWGVPSFKYGDLAVWGQDRIDAIEQAICRSIKQVNAKSD